MRHISFIICGECTMNTDTIVIYTSKSTETIRADGGTQSWKIDAPKARQNKYVVICRNAKSGWAQDNKPHNSAFLVGTISDIVPSTETDGRWKILIEQYAEVTIPDVWEGRYPVRYTALSALDIKIEELDLQPMPQSPDEVEVQKQVPPKPLSFSELINAKKIELSKELGLDASKIEISVRM